MARIVVLFIFALSSAYAGTVGGTLQGPSGIAIKNATLEFGLQQAGLIIGSGSIVPLAVSCYTSTDGSVVGIPNPTANVVSSVNYNSGSLPGGVYYVETTFYSGSQESLPSPELRVQLIGSGTLIITPQASFPANAAGMRVYIGVTPGGETLQGQTANSTAQYSQAAALTGGTSAPVANSTTCSIAFNDTIIPYSGYNVSLISSTGSAYPGWPQEWQLNGGADGVVNISSGAPLWNGVIVYPQPIVAQPLNHGPQSISGALGLSGYNLVNVSAIGVGTATPGWALDAENGAVNASGGFLSNGAAPLNHILLGNGTAYVDSATVPSSALPLIYYQQVLANSAPLPSEPGIGVLAPLSAVDNPGVSTSVGMSSSGVTPGSYTTADITVDAYGRVTAASNGSYSGPVIQTAITTAGICSTANTGYATCVTAVAWPLAFADANYSATCSMAPPTTTTGGATPFLVLYVSAKSAAGLTVVLQNADASAAGVNTTSELDCIGVHP